MRNKYEIWWPKPVGLVSNAGELELGEPRCCEMPRDVYLRRRREWVLENGRDQADMH